jgi:hypothetical protein
MPSDGRCKVGCRHAQDMAFDSFQLANRTDGYQHSWSEAKVQDCSQPPVQAIRCAPCNSTCAYPRFSQRHAHHIDSRWSGCLASFFIPTCHRHSQLESSADGQIFYWCLTYGGWYACMTATVQGKVHRFTNPLSGVSVPAAMLRKILLLV